MTGIVRPALRLWDAADRSPTGMIPDDVCVLSRNMTADTCVLADAYAPIQPYLERVERVIADELFSRHTFVNHLCDRVGRYRGKMLRPALLLLSGDAAGDINDDHYVLAAVVEMVHLATLVHDDVLDDSDRRRRQPTVNATHGNVTAVLLGDYLISHTYHLCSSLADQHAARAIAATTNTVCEGELLEIHHRRDDAVTEADYFDIIRSKTAALTGTCCALGAHYAHGDEATVTRMHEFGVAAGTAFQIVDDILDIVGDNARTGKNLGLDLAHGSATLPVIHCLRSAPPNIRRALTAFVQGRSPADPDHIRSCLDRSESIDYAFDVARGYVDSATKCLQHLPPSPARDSLQALSEFILRRRY